jgi:hypothetical protein
MVRSRHVPSRYARPATFPARAMRTSSLETSTAQRYYSSMQIGVATLIGGPLAGGYLAASDHTAFGAPDKGRWVLLASAVVIVGLIYMASFLPDEAPYSGLPFLVAILYRIYAQYALEPAIAQRRAEGWLQFSWWRAVGISLAFLAGVLALAVAAVALFKIR